MASFGRCTLAHTLLHSLSPDMKVDGMALRVEPTFLFTSMSVPGSRECRIRLGRSKLFGFTSKSLHRGTT